jgi:adenylylsulfate kinase
MRGVTVWFTGLPGSGKSTVARQLAVLLANRGVAHELLDGDQVRRSLSKGLGFSRADRDDNVQRIGLVCQLLTRNGVVAIAAVVSPYAATRDEVRASIGDFVEVHVATPLADCERRDTRGRYEAARRGEIRGFTGVDDPYEAPVHPDLRVDCAAEPPELCAARVIALLEQRGYVPTAEELGGQLRGTDPLERRLKRLGYA